MNSHNTTKPPGGVPMQCAVEPPDPNDHLLEQILSSDNVPRSLHVPTGRVSAIRFLAIRTSPYRSNVWKFPNQRAEPVRWVSPR
jgi:hypothetical protein